MSETRSTFDSWAILEIMGHVTLAGRVTEQAIGGASFIRIDVPECGNQKAFTRFYGAGSIYSITPVDEETARLAAGRLRPDPITIYGLARQLPAGQTRIDRRYYGDGELGERGGPDPYGVQDDLDEDEELSF